MQRNWDAVLGRLLTVIGASSTSMVAFGCVDTPDDLVGKAPRTDAAKSPSKGDAGAVDVRMDSGSTSKKDSSVMDSARSREGATSLNEAGIRTTRVFAREPSCPRYPVVSHTGAEIAYQTSAEQAVLAATCSAEAAEEYQADHACFDAPRDGGTCDQAYDHACVADEYHGGLITRATFVCGPLRMTDAGCCYVLTGSNAIGRPFLVEGALRRAAAQVGTGWAVRCEPDVRGLDGDTRRALADAYTREAMAEHASVASFSRFALQCLACGAPSALVRGAQQAALDEVAHAELALGLAAAYGGTELCPGRLDVRGALDGELDPIGVARSVAREGAIAETVSALIVAAARDAAEEPAVRAILTRVAEEELEHALLAWKYLRWAVEQGGDAMRAALEPIFASAAAHVGFGSMTQLRGDELAMRAHGYLPTAERKAVAEQALSQVVATAAQALLRRGAPALTWADELSSS